MPTTDEEIAARLTGKPPELLRAAARLTHIEKLVLVPVWPEAKGLFSETEQAALAWTESVTRIAEGAAPDEVYEAALDAFGEKGLADLTVAIGLMNAYNRLGISFHATPAAVAKA